MGLSSQEEKTTCIFPFLGVSFLLQIHGAGTHMQSITWFRCLQMKPRFSTSVLAAPMDLELSTHASFKGLNTFFPPSIL